MCGTVTEEKARLQISKYFPWCPFCCFEQLEFDVEPDRDSNYISCENCGAKWKLNMQEKIKSVELVATSIDWKGKELLDKEMEPQFWQNKAWICVLTRKTPKKQK